MSSVEQQLKSLVRSARKKPSTAGSRFIGVRCDPSEPLPSKIDVDDEPWRVHRVRSPLEARMALVDAGEEGRALLVTPMAGVELGLEVTARLAARKLQDLQPWQSVRELFQARRLDPRVVTEGAWLARELLATVPAGGYPPAPSGILDLDTAWAAVLQRLRLPGRPGMSHLLAASTGGSFGSSWFTLEDDFRKAIGRRLRDTAGPVGQQVLGAIEAGHGEDLVPLGLVLDLLLAEEVLGQPRALIVRTRMETMGLHLEEPRLVAPWASEAMRWVVSGLGGTEVARKQAERALDRAEELVEQLGARDLAEASALLRCGLRARTSRLAEALLTGAHGNLERAKAEQAFERLRSHQLAQFDPAIAARRARAEDALRLARWLAGPNELPSSLGAQAYRYRCEGAYVDRVRQSIARGEGDPELVGVFSALVEVAAQRREAENRSFAEQLARAYAGTEGAGDVLLIEEALERVVVPLAKRLSVLLVVMDGMSQAVAEELVEDLQRQSRLQRMSPSEHVHLPPMVGLLPSVTEVCRASLLCGRKTVGDQAQELEGFDQLASKHGWRGRAASQRLLFHKAELTGTHLALGKEVQAAIESSAKVVAVVVNVVDDQLSKGDQLRLDWKLDRVPVLQELVQRAELVGRAIVLTADHGHVVETGATRKVGSTGTESRWRRATGALEDGEIEVRGERVLLPTAGGPCVTPWSECVRYSNPHAGYHGGASPQEVVTPLVVLVPEARCEELEGWRPEVHDPPWWWDGRDPSEVLPPVEPRPVAAPAVRKAPRKELTGPLFPMASPDAGTETRTARPGWLEALFVSPVWSQQRQLAGRTPPADQDVAEVLIVLTLAGGKLSLEALRNRTRFTPMRLRGLLTAMERILNVDGYAVLEVDHGVGEVQLVKGLLFTQFGLQEA